MNGTFSTAILLILLTCAGRAQNTTSRIVPVNFSEVAITDAFWKPKMETVANITLGVCVNYTRDKTGRIRNFGNAAKRSGKWASK